MKILIKEIIILFAAISIMGASCKKKGTSDNNVQTPKTFSNPLQSGADPWVVKKDSFYYFTQTLGNRIAVWKTKSMTKLGCAPITTIFSPTLGAPNSENIWAPEIHYINNKWFVYYTAGKGADSTQRTWVLENDNPDPTTSNWSDKGKIYAANANFWAIDGSLLEYNGSYYFIWSGRPDQSKQNQNIYIAKMTDPLTIQSQATLLTKPELPWEVNGGPVNEGPEILKNSSGKVFLIYSASGCWTDDYCLGMLTLKSGGDPLTALDWTKSSSPVFTKNIDGSAFGPGHCGFFKSQDGTEDWIIYHANSNTNEGCSEKRNVRIQKFIWNTDGTSNFGIPVQTGLQLNVPSGE